MFASQNLVMDKAKQQNNICFLKDKPPNNTNSLWTTQQWKVWKGGQKVDTYGKTQKHRHTNLTNEGAK